MASTGVSHIGVRKVGGAKETSGWSSESTTVSENTQETDRAVTGRKVSVALSLILVASVALVGLPMRIVSVIRVYIGGRVAVGAKYSGRAPVASTPQLFGVTSPVTSVVDSRTEPKRYKRR